MNTWLVVGSAPSVYGGLRRAAGQDIRATITCNRGIEIVQTPNVYALCDAVACERFAEKARYARKRGTLCVTLRRDPMALDARGIAWFDVLIQNGHPWEPFQMTGLWILEYAIRVGRADCVIMAGMDGYRGDGTADYFTGETGKAKDRELTERVIGPLTARLVKKYPAVHFCCYGHPKYQIEADNWTVTPV